MKIQLPNFIIAELYKDLLVVTDDKELLQTDIQNTTPTPIAAIPLYAGNNLQHICIIVNNEIHPFTDEDSLQLLSNLLAALHFNLGDVAIINHQRTPVDYSVISQELQPRVCLLFGIRTPALQLPFIIPDYQLQRYEACTFLQACPIEAMCANDDKAKAEKRKLWNCLKTVFNK